MWRPATTLDRYFLRELSLPFVFGAGLLTFFLLLDRLYHLTELVVARGVPPYLVLQLLALTLPGALTYSLPMAFLMAVLLAGARLAGDLEIVALKAAGVGLARLFVPVLAAATAVALFTGTLTLFINPSVHGYFQSQLFRILEARAVTGLKERVFSTSFGRFVLYVEELSPSGLALRHVLVADERDPAESRILTAREGRLFSDTAARRVVLRLLDGDLHEADTLAVEAPASAGPTRAAAGGAAGPARYRHTLFASYDMTLELGTVAGSGGQLDKPEKDLALGALRQALARPDLPDPTRRAFAVELHKRVAVPLAALVFALVAFPLAVRAHRGGRATALVATLAILVTYYLVLTTLEGMALRGRLAPWLALWLPNLCFGLAGTLFLAATTRDWRPVWPLGLRRALAMVTECLPLARGETRRVDALTRRGRAWSVLDRYILRRFAGLLGLALLVAIALIVVVDLLQTLDRFLRHKPPLVWMLLHFAFRVPVALLDALPMALLVATLLLMLTLTRAHELTAIKAAGVSVHRALVPVLLCAVAAALTAGALQETVVPWLNERGEDVDRVRIRGQAPRHLQVRHGVWLRGHDGRFQRVALLHPAAGELHGVSVLELDGGFRVVARTDARVARWSEGRWALADALERRFSPSGLVERTLSGVGASLGVRFEELVQLQHTTDAMGYRELRRYVDRLAAAGADTTRYLVDLHHRLAFPLKNLVMVLVAIPLALQAPRAGRLYGVGLAIGIMSGYLVVHYVALSLGRAQLLPALWGAWAANVVFLGLGLVLLARART